MKYKKLERQTVLQKYYGLNKIQLCYSLITNLG